MDETLLQRLAPAIRRLRFRRIWLVLGVTWYLLAMAVACATFMGFFDGMLPFQRILWLVAGSVAATLLAFLAAFAFVPGLAAIGQMIEKRYPELDSRLMTAMEMRPTEQGYSFLQQDVMRQAFTHSLSHRWGGIVPAWQLIATPLMSLLSLGLLLVAMGLSLSHRPDANSQQVEDFSVVTLDPSLLEMSVEPGDTEVERGTSLLVLARFEGGVPPEVRLRVESEEDGEQATNNELRSNKAAGDPEEDDQESSGSRVVTMDRGLDDPIFGNRISSISTPVRYRVEYGETVSDWYQVQVFDYPALIRSDALVRYPDYTKRSPQTIADVQRLSAVEGSEVTMTFHLNKPVEQAIWKCLEYDGKRSDIDQHDLSILPTTVGSQKYELTFSLEKSCRYQLELVDGEGRANQVPARFSLTALENQPPQLKVLKPGRDMEVSALEEMSMSAEVWDDFGLVATGLTLNRPGQPAVEFTLGNDLPGDARHLVNQLVALERLEVKPDDLVSYHFWAEDLNRDGEVRRVVSDIFFAEVRPFDQIFRQGQQPTAQQMQQQGQGQGQGAGAGQEAGQAAEQQKLVISATWNVQRQYALSGRDAAVSENVPTIVEAQNQVRDQVGELQQQITDNQSKQHAQSAVSNMTQAAEALEKAAANPSQSALQQALDAEQSAYQDLLRLREREFEVVRMEQQQQPSASQSASANSRSQQQMQQLNLEDDQNRYEEERTAGETPTEQSPEARENRQVLNRLRELAQRQEDLVERINELQSALQQAETEAARQELERRLKSLQDQQRDLIRDADELSERMQEENNRQNMGQESSELQDARQQMQSTSEALQDGQLSQAAAEGSRAQEQLDNLKEEFQRRTSSQFRDAMQEMRQQARDLESRQQEILDEFSEEQPISTNRPSLRDQPESSLLDRMTEQQQQLDQLRERMKETIQEAEGTEPLLAEELYDTYRDSEQQRIPERLRNAARALERGWQPEAESESLQAAEDLEQLREGIETAAESVLGDELESLRAAESTLERLRSEVDRERAANTGEGSEADSQADDTQPRDASEARDSERDQQSEPRGQGQDGDAPGRQQGQPNSEGQDPSEGQQGEGQQGEGQQGEGQQGEGQQGQGQQGQGQQGEGQQGEGQQGQGQQGQGQGQGQRDGQPGGRGQGEPSPDGAGSPEDTPQDAANRGRRTLDQLIQAGGGFAPNRSGGTGNVPVRSPLTGEDYREWSDRLRDVEEMISDPELRSEAARIREEAREIRRDLQRHSEEPNWDLVEMKISQPLEELQRRVMEEIIRRTSDRELVPTDRDPVPGPYRDAVQRYYERLGIGK